MKRSRRYSRKLAEWPFGSPTYSSRWNTVIASQGIVCMSLNAASTSNCEAPVATTRFAVPRSRHVARSDSAA